MDWKKASEEQKKRRIAQMRKDMRKNRARRKGEVAKSGVGKKSTPAKKKSAPYHGPLPPSPSDIVDQSRWYSEHQKRMAQRAAERRRKQRRKRKPDESVRKMRESRTQRGASKKVKPANPFKGAEDQIRYNKEITKARSKEAKKQNRSYRAAAERRRLGTKASKGKNAARLARVKSGDYKGKYYGPDEFKGNLAKIAAWKKAGGKRSDIKKFA